MDNRRLEKRVQAAVARAGRKFSPRVACLCGDAELRVPGALVVEPDASVRGASVGRRGTLVLSESAADSLETFLFSQGRGRDFSSCRFRIGEDVWDVEVEAAPFLVKDELGQANISLWREVASR